MDQAWSLNYEIKHQIPNSASTYAQLVKNDETIFTANKTELGRFDDVIMFYNAWSPPTSFKIESEFDKVINSKRERLVVKKLFYGHYCTTEDINNLLSWHEDKHILKDSIVICKYGYSGRPDKAAAVKPYGAKAVLMFSDPFDYSEKGESGIDDAGIPWDTVQRGKSAYFRGDPTTPGYPSYFGTYAGSIQEMLTKAQNEVHGPHLISPLPQQPISINDAQYLLNMLPSHLSNDMESIKAWQNGTALKLTNVGGELAEGMEFRLQIAPNYERFISQDIIGSDLT